jgi:hypothetical protein
MRNLDQALVGAGRSPPADVAVELAGGWCGRTQSAAGCQIAVWTGDARDTRSIADLRLNSEWRRGLIGWGASSGV